MLNEQNYELFSSEKVKKAILANEKILVTCGEMKNMQATLILITESFPYGGITETPFVSAEIDALSHEWDRVILMPMVNRGDAFDLSPWPNVEVCDDWINCADNRIKSRRAVYLMSVDVIRSAMSSHKYSDMTFALSAVAFKRFLKRYMARHGLSAENTLVYTFWLDYPTMGALMAADGLKVVSRAHGYDVVSRRAMSMRERVIGAITGIYAASMHSCESLQRTYPQISDKIKVSYLGSRKPLGMSTCHVKADNKLTFMSCSRVEPVKNVCSNYRLIKALAIARPGTSFKWIHIGSGSEMPRLRQMVSESVPSNLTVEIRGAEPNDKVHGAYISEPIDWFMLLSSYEGCPIAVCEALSYGIPVIATDVGGTSEMVDDDCGLLMPVDPEPEEFVRGILPYLESELRYGMLRDGALRKWQTGFSADSLRREFAKKLRMLLS